MIEKSCYTCISAGVSKEKYPCNKCHNQNNWRYRYSVQSLCLVGVCLIVVGSIIVL